VNPLRAYLLVWRSVGDWDVSVHHNLESLQETWRPLAGKGTSAVIHVGFWRPDTEELEAAVLRWPRLVLLTASARYSFPESCGVASRIASLVGTLPLYVAIEGWGYEVSADDLGLSQTFLHGDETDTLVAKSTLSVDSNDWISNLAQDDTNLAEEAKSRRLIDDATYLAEESKLPTALRIQFGWQRYLFHARQSQRPKSLLDNLYYAPTWLLDLPLAALNLSVRSSNCLRASSVHKIGDLAEFGEQGLFKVRNLGRTSVQEIEEEVARAFSAGPVQPTKPVQLSLPETSIENEFGTTRTVEKFETKDSQQAAIVNGFVGVLYNIFASMNEKKATLMRMRMGFECERKTLQEVGEKFLVSRERIRQIESQCIREFARQIDWKREVESRLTQMLRDRSDPLPLLGLEILDRWFIGVEKYEFPFEYLLDHVCDKRFSLVRMKGQVYVSKIDQNKWNRAVKSGRSILEAEVGSLLRESVARNIIDPLLVGGGEELRAELWVEVTRWAHFVSADEVTGERTLVSFGSGAESAVEAVLMESDRPLHFTEIARRCTAQTGRIIDVRRAHNSAANVGLLFGRGTYGMPKHFPLSDVELGMLVAEAEDLIEGGESTKQWHSREIAESLEARGLDFGGGLTQYIVSIALEKSRSLVYLGRMVWQSKSPSAQRTTKRLDVHQAIVSLLMLEGRPMHTNEIRDKLVKNRGLSGAFQIQPEGPLLRVGVGLWGLVNRDLPFSEIEAQKVTLEMVSVLNKRGAGIHVSEIKAALLPFAPQIISVNDPTLFLGLAQKSDAFAVSKGQYVYLAKWGEPRRLTLLEAVKRTLTQAGSEGMTLIEGIPQVERLLQRTVSRPSFSSACQHFGAIYDESTARWTISLDISEEVEETIGLAAT